MSIKSKVISALSWTASARFAGQLATWAITIYVIRILSPDDYGLISMATVMIGFAFLINELGVIPAFIQADDINDYHVRQIFGVVLVSNGLVYAAVLVAAPYFAMFFEDDRLTEIIRVLATSLLIAAPSAVPTAMLQREIRFNPHCPDDFVI